MRNATYKLRGQQREDVWRKEPAPFKSQRALLFGPGTKMTCGMTSWGAKKALNDAEKPFREDRVVSNAFRILPTRNGSNRPRFGNVAETSFLSQIHLCKTPHSL